jgi:small subunit ribosomal protein S9
MNAKSIPKSSSKKPVKKTLALAVGKRKTAIARVILREGTGAFTVNHRPMPEFFQFDIHSSNANASLKAVELEERFDVMVTVKGGGLCAQSIATQHGLARALIQYDPELRKILKPLHMLRRDDRKKERKKYGQKGARKQFQYSKR